MEKQLYVSPDTPFIWLETPRVRVGVSFAVKLIIPMEKTPVQHYEAPRAEIEELEIRCSLLQTSDYKYHSLDEGD